MKGDFTRRTFRGGNHYRGVLLQQGRVQLDADWNEQLDIQLHHDETTARDAIGAHGGPQDAAGFAVTGPDGGDPRACPPEDLWLSAGRYYVGGILCENEQPVPLGGQPDLPGVPLPSADGRYAAYLDVWREHLTAVERPELREVALGGPDTATRNRTVWQLRLEPLEDHEATPAQVAPPWAPRGSGPTGRLRARAQPPGTSATPCVIPPSAGYRRLENQLYRVEIHEGSEGMPSFVWSRDNGTVVAGLTGISGNDLTIAAPGRDDLLGFAKGDWVEVVDLARTRRGEPGFLARLDEAGGTELKVAEWAGTPPGAADLTGTQVVRRWDSPGALPVDVGWVDLEDGVQVEFEEDTLHRCGDYWLIPARTAALSETDLDSDLAGDIEWPRDVDGPVFQSPDGIEHHTAVVALLDRVDGAWTREYDCRSLFAPLAEVRADPTPPKAPGLHVEHVTLRGSGRELGNDTAIAMADLLGGITVGLDGVPSPVALTGKPVLTLALDLPYPLSPAERDAWHLGPGTVLGTQPLDLAGQVSVDGQGLLWTPAASLHDWLPDLSLHLLSNQLAERVCCRLTVNGRAVTDADHPDRLLNGLALTRPRPDGGIDLLFPTVDDVRGADFTMWFWLEPASTGGVFDDSNFDERVFQ